MVRTTFQTLKTTFFYLCAVGWISRELVLRAQVVVGTVQVRVYLEYRMSLSMSMY